MFVLVLVGAGAVLAGLRMIAIPAPVNVATLKGEPQRMTFADGALYWLETEGASRTPSRLAQLKLGGAAQVAARVLVSDAKMVSFAVAEQDVYYVEENSSSVKRLSTNGGQPTDVIPNAKNPGEVYADEKHLYWTETTPAALPFVAHVPIANYMTTIHQASRAGGSPRVLATVESTEPQFAGRLLRAQDGTLSWLEWMKRGQGTATTAVKTVTEKGDVSLLALMPGEQSCVPREDALYCTTFSEEGSPPSRYVAIKRLSLRSEEMDTLTDWLDLSGTLVADSRSVYYLVRRNVWIVPERLGASDLGMALEEGEKVCYLRDGLVFSYLPTGGSIALRQRSFKSRNFLMRFLGMGQ
jgi:hypothetical protein